MLPTRIISLSGLRHTWVLDLDGTLVKHNGYKYGTDEWLPGALRFLRSIPDHDFVMILTARELGARPRTLEFLSAASVRYDLIVFEMPTGERILLNDTKPTGLKCAYAIETNRDEGLAAFSIEINPAL